MEPLKVGDLCLVLVDSFPARDIKAGEEVTIINCGMVHDIVKGSWVLRISNDYRYHIENKDGRQSFAVRSSLMKISPDSRIKLEQVREAIKA